MALMTVWPTDAADGSVSSEARWRLMARQWLPSGCCAGVGGDMAPSLAGSNLTVAAGAAWVDGHYCELAGSQVLATTVNGLAVVRFDPAANTAELLYRDGATIPTQNIGGLWEQPIAKIAASALTDVRALVNANTPTRFPNTTARDLWANRPSGVRCITTDTNTTWFWNGTAWIYTPPPPVAYVVNGIASSSGGNTTTIQQINIPASPFPSNVFVWSIIFVAMAGGSSFSWQIKGNGVTYTSYSLSSIVTQTSVLNATIPVPANTAVAITLSGTGAANNTTYADGSSNRMDALRVFY